MWLAFEQDGAYYPLDTTEVGVVFEATALLVNCLKTIPETGSTVMPGGFTLSSANHVMTVNNGSIAVDELPNWDVYRRSLGGVKTIICTATGQVLMALVIDSLALFGATARAAGALRPEGRDYEMQDSDMVEFLFSK